MFSLNKCTLAGNVGSSPVFKTTTKGHSRLSFSVATTEKTKNNEFTSWHNIVVWDKAADALKDMVKSGSVVYIEGRLGTRSYLSNRNEKKYITEVTASKVKILPIGRAYKENLKTFLNGEETVEQDNSCEIDLDDLDLEIPF